MLGFIKDKELCTGCSACKAACPVHCISMRTDEEGFPYPEADVEKCINCKICERVCPLNNSKTSKVIEEEQKVITARTKNHKTWLASASGGAFTEICKALGDDIFVFGAVIERGVVSHEYSEGLKDIAKFRKSKYVQSDMGDTFTEVKKLLKQEKKVVFTGTPCQIAGLNSFLGKTYSNLFLIDFICHGVGSPYVLKRCMEYVGKENDMDCDDFQFRKKKIVQGKLSIYVSTYKDNIRGKTIELSHKRDPYNSLFFSQLCLRPCCQTNCQFRHPNRISDVTLADYKSVVIRSTIPVPDYKNYSTIVFNSVKGNSLYPLLYKNMIVYPSSLDELEHINPLYFKTTKGNAQRDAFFLDFIQGKEIDFLLNKYVNNDGVKQATIPSSLLRVIRFKILQFVNRILDLIHCY